MKSPDITTAVISLHPAELMAFHQTVTALERAPEAKKQIEASIIAIQRSWRGMDEADIQREAEERQAERERESSPYPGVIVGGGSRLVRATLKSEHPLLAGAAEIVKQGPPVHFLTSKDDAFWKLHGYSDEAIERIRMMPPEEDPPYEEPERLEDRSQGSGLVLMGLNTRTGQVALGGYDFPAAGEGESRFDFGFVMSRNAVKETVQVTLLERGEGLAGSTMSADLLQRLVHLRLV